MLRLQRLGGLILAVALLAGTGWYIRSLHARVAVAEQAAKTAQDALKKRAATSARRSEIVQPAPAQRPRRPCLSRMP
jgi:hypothetical protein